MKNENPAPSPAFLIDEARPEDAEILARFNCAMATETEERKLNPETVLKGVRAIFAKRERGRYLVARSGSEVVGQLLLTLEWSDWRNGEIWWIQSVYVHPDHRNQGIYKSLYRAVREEAESRDDVVGIRLYVEHNNDRAQAVYKKLGMKAGGYEVMEAMKS
ncbi:MAG: GNAT family N-acetyltransferase [Planctomycetaceae bacterium]|nr:GNAT family N-acetyltransferase [Planctomycetaceae bacterium]